MTNLEQVNLSITSEGSIVLRTVVDVIKLILQEIQISPKLRNGKKFVLMSNPALKCENNASFKQIFNLKLIIAIKMAYSCCFSFGGNLDFPKFLQKKFYNINCQVSRKPDQCKKFLMKNTILINQISNVTASSSSFDIL